MLASHFDQYESMAQQSSACMSPNSGETSEDTGSIAVSKPGHSSSFCASPKKSWYGRKQSKGAGHEAAGTLKNDAAMQQQDTGNNGGDALPNSADSSKLWYASAGLLTNPNLSCDDDFTEMSSGNSGDPSSGGGGQVSVPSMAARNGHGVRARPPKRKANSVHVNSAHYTGLLNTRSGQGRLSSKSLRLQRPYSQDSNGYMPMLGPGDLLDKLSSTDNSGESGQWTGLTTKAATPADPESASDPNMASTGTKEEADTSSKPGKEQSEDAEQKPDSLTDPFDDEEETEGSKTTESKTEEAVNDSSPSETTETKTTSPNHQEHKVSDIHPYAVVHRRDADRMMSPNSSPMLHPHVPGFAMMSSTIPFRHDGSNRSGASSGYHSRHGSNVTEFSQNGSWPIRHPVPSNKGSPGSTSGSSSRGNSSWVMPLTASPPPPPAHLPASATGTKYPRRMSLPLAAPSPPPSSPAMAMFRHPAASINRVGSPLPGHQDPSLQTVRLRSATLPQSSLSRERPNTTRTRSDETRSTPGNRELPPVPNPHDVPVSGVRAPTPDPRVINPPNTFPRSSTFSRGILKSGNGSGHGSHSGHNSPRVTIDAVEKQQERSSAASSITPGGHAERVLSPLGNRVYSPVPGAGRVSPGLDLRPHRNRPGSSLRGSRLEQLPEGSNESICDIGKETESPVEKNDAIVDDAKDMDASPSLDTAAEAPTRPVDLDTGNDTNDRSSLVRWSRNTLRRWFRRSQTALSLSADGIHSETNRSSRIPHAPVFTASGRARSQPAVTSPTAAKKTKQAPIVSITKSLPGKATWMRRPQSMIEFESAQARLPSKERSASERFRRVRRQLSSFGSGSPATQRPRIASALSLRRPTSVDDVQLAEILSKIDSRPQAALPTEEVTTLEPDSSQECVINGSNDVIGDGEIVYDVADRGMVILSLVQQQCFSASLLLLYRSR